MSKVVIEMWKDEILQKLTLKQKIDYEKNKIVR